MRDNLKISLDFVNRIRKVKGILQIVLFGSVARGEDKAGSDVDIAIVHDIKDTEKIKSMVNKIVHEKIQVVYLHVDNLPNEIELVSALTGEGLLPYGKPLNIILNKKEINPFILIVYDTTNLEKKQRMLLNRALHGSVSKSNYKGKTYKTETKGIVAQEGITKLTKACLLVEPKKATLIKNVFKRFNVGFKQEMIWK